MRSILKNILIPIDFSSASLNALNTAINMAKRHQADLHLLNVHDISSFYPKIGQTDKFEPFTYNVFQKNKYLMKKIALAILKDSQVNCHLYSEIGCMEKNLKKKAGDLNIDLIVIGTTPDLYNKSYVFGTFPFRILKNVSCNVLTVPVKKTIDKFTRIIFPVFAKNDPMQRLYTARSIMKKNNSEISIVGIMGKNDGNLSSVVEAVSERVRSRRGMFTGFPTTNLLYIVNPENEMSKICQDANAELIVINGTTDRNLKEFFFGNFTQKMIRNPETAVLCVKD
ncbi:MAG: universal stress protein [Ferruginibacter sp.]